MLPNIQHGASLQCIIDLAGEGWMRGLSENEHTTHSVDTALIGAEGAVTPAVPSRLDLLFLYQPVANFTALSSEPRDSNTSAGENNTTRWRVEQP